MFFRFSNTFMLFFHVFKPKNRKNRNSEVQGRIVIRNPWILIFMQIHGLIIAG